MIQNILAVPLSVLLQIAPPLVGAPPPPPSKDAAEGRPAPAGTHSDLSSPTEHVMSLAEAEKFALEHQAQLAQALAEERVAEGKVMTSRSPLLPQVTGTATYSRQTGNYAPRPGQVPSSAIGGAVSSRFDSFNSYNFGVSASQLVWDFGQARGLLNASKSMVDAQKENLANATLTVLSNARAAYFQGWAQRALVEVARENLANQERHLLQVQGFVEGGAKPEIELAQVRADRANARLKLTNTENSYEIAKAQLAQAIGWESAETFDVGDDRLSPVPGEGDSVEIELRRALALRPDVRALIHQSMAQGYQLDSAHSELYPTLTASAGVTEGGVDLTNLAWNWNAGAQLTWPIFQGGVSRAKIHQVQAQGESLRAQATQIRNQVRFDLQQSKLAVRAASVSIETAREVALNARARLQMAEGRYQAGVGTIIELQDAQVAATDAAAQVVQAEYNLSIARAQLLHARGLAR